MDTEEKLRELVNYAIHHLSCGYTSNNERILVLQHLQRGLHNVDAVEQSMHPTGGGLCAICGKSANHHEDHVFVVLQSATSG